jgi:glycosyltransferase involved in cell wall biosynthesis
MKRVYIVFSTQGVGGAEKRFTDIWHELCSRGMDVHLVLDKKSLTGLQRQRGYAEKLASSTKLHILDFAGSHYIDFVRAVWSFFSEQPSGVIVHYPLAPLPLSGLRFSHRVIISWVDTSLPKLSPRLFKLWIISWMGFIFADRIDVLNPKNLRRIADSWCLTSKSSLTEGGTHIDPRTYQRNNKRLDFVFLGRLEPGKQGLRFMKTLPEVHKTLLQNGYADYRFIVCGDGSDYQSIRALAASNAYKDIPLLIGHTDEPEVVLGQAAVYFSLQEVSNYPSKALAEAMACGAYPIMTDTPDTLLMVDKCSHFQLVPRHFSPEDISDALLRYLAIHVDERDKIAAEVSAFAVNRFTIVRQASYFEKLYKTVSQA